MRRVLKKMRSPVLVASTSLYVSFENGQRFRLLFSFFFSHPATLLFLRSSCFIYLFLSKQLPLLFRVKLSYNGRVTVWYRLSVTLWADRVYPVTSDPWSRGRAKSNATVRVKNRDAAISATDWFILSFEALLRKTVEAIQYLWPARCGYAFEWIWSSVVSTDFHSIWQVTVNQRNSPTVSPIQDFSCLFSSFSFNVTFPCTPSESISRPESVFSLPSG